MNYGNKLQTKIKRRIDTGSTCHQSSIELLWVMNDEIARVQAEGVYQTKNKIIWESEERKINPAVGRFIVDVASGTSTVEDR